MKRILFVVLILQSNLTFSQSKKAQIEQFKVSVDSLKNVLENERNVNLKKVQELNAANVNFENQISLLKTEVKDATNNLNQKQLENDQLKNNLNLNLAEIIGLKSTLENERNSNLKKVQGLNVAIGNFENQISLLKSEIKDAVNNLNQKQLENAQLKADLNLNLTEITTLKIQSLNKGDSLNIISNELRKIKTTTQSTNSVQTIKIGVQEWMAEDLKITAYNNGDPIYEAKQEKQWKDCGDKKKGCFRKLSNGTFVYNGFALNDKRGILPSGFIIPKYEQFNQLIKFLGGGNTREGKAVKSLATYPIYLEKWNEKEKSLEGVEIKTNGKSGFKAKKGGHVYDHGALDNEGECSYWWTSTIEGEGTKAFDIGYCTNDIGGGCCSFSSSFGFAVRAIKK